MTMSKDLERSAADIVLVPEVRDEWVAAVDLAAEKIGTEWLDRVTEERFFEQPNGQLLVDAGAVRMLVDRDKWEFNNSIN